jgi:replication factor C subunit 3/5
MADAAVDVMDTSETGGASSSAFEVPSSKKRNRDAQIASLPWVEKYRPKDMSDLVSHEEIISTITRLIDAGKLPHLLLYGPPGTGKTSTILACAHNMYGKSFSSMVLELNASDERGIDVVRDQIKEFASTRQMFTSAPKLIILDEADAMTNAAQFALRRVIEKYTKNARFCLICNYASKIIPALQSRCTRFRFAPLEPAQARERLAIVAEAEHCVATPDGLDACVTLGTGDMRKCLNILQSTHMVRARGEERRGKRRGERRGVARRGGRQHPPNCLP